MEHNSNIVAIGKFISESTCKRKKKEIKINDIVLDNYDRKTKTIHEVKKSGKMEETQFWQLKYYISLLKGKGIKGVKGKIDYPKLRQTVDVELTERDEEVLSMIKSKIKNIPEKDKPSEVINRPFCKKCSYYDLCYV